MTDYYKKTAGLLALAGILGGCSQTKNEPERFNILMITCEDISPMLGCYGDSTARTPVLDKLAEDGVVFTNVFATMGVSAPARASLITGMYPSTFGANHMRTNRKGLPDGIPPYEAVPPAEVKCYTEFFRKAGYYTTNNEKTDYQFASPVTAWDECSRYAHWRNRPVGMPFFSIFNLITTHESQVWDRANDPAVIRPEDVVLPPYYPDTKNVRRDLARVYSNITVMDREVGELIKELKNEGLYESTIIVFYSDHGGPLPRQKREITDSGLHVPFIIRFPQNQYAGTVIDDLISFIDIPPTMLSLAGIEPPEYMHGQAFWGAYKAETPRDYVFAARDRVDSEYDIRRSVRDKHYRYIRNYMPETGAYQDVEFRYNLAMMNDMLRLRDEGMLNDEQMYWFRESKTPEELYALAEDPHELNNVASNSRYAEVLRRMRDVHENWMAEFGDKGLMSEKELVWSMWPGGNQPVTAMPRIYQTAEGIVISSETEGASIAFMINKNTPGHHKRWLLYHKPVEAAAGDTISAVAVRIGYRQSDESHVILSSEIHAAA